ncbi:MAG: aldolase/citrate lyase family protein, partial [Chloroflexi bacterium]|nr:aldolase/citrate lyase family protein [Chloroflexota bacterium]
KSHAIGGWHNSRPGHPVSPTWEAQLEVARRQSDVQQRPQGVGHGGHHRDVLETDRPSSPGGALRDRIHAGEPTFGAWAGLGSPASVELLGRAGLDWIVVDLEHGAATEADLVAHLTAIEVTGAVALVRPQSAERLRIGRALDFGAAGLVIPRLDTVEQVREALGHLRYPPAGGRGVALLTRGGRLGAVDHAGVAALNDDIVGIVQIESPGALAAADEIAAIDGVDVLFVGPADLSHSLGVPGQFASERYRAALRSVVAACRAHGKAAGILLYDPQAFGPHLDLGFTFVGLGADSSFVLDGARTALATARSGGAR